MQHQISFDQPSSRTALISASVDVIAPADAWCRPRCLLDRAVGGFLRLEGVRARYTVRYAGDLREPVPMPWTPDDAERHTHKATTWALKELWAKVANKCLERTGDEGRAIREANAVVARQAEDQ
jgi:hypothetical protein